MATKKQTEILVEDEQDATVIETINNQGESTKRLSYPVKIKQNEIKDSETENENEDFSNEDFSQFPLREIEDIPKDKIDVFFDEIREALQNENDSFYIRLIRQPDGFDDMFFNRCQDQMRLGVFGCYLRDANRIDELIQRKNNNSGGRFTLIALDRNQDTLQFKVGFEFDAESRQRVPVYSPVIARDVVIANPIKEEVKESGSNETIQMFREMMDNQNRQFDRMFQAIQGNQNQQPQRTLLDSLNELKLVKELTEPPKDNDQQFRVLQNEIYQAKLINQLIKDETPAPNSSENEAWWQTAMKSPEIVDLAKQIGLTAFNGFSQLMLAKQFTQQQQASSQQSVVSNQPNPQIIPQAIPQQIENQIPQGLETQPEQKQQMFDDETMKLFTDLTDKILNELKTTNPIDENNKVLKDLTTEFPQAYPMLKTMVKNLTFDDALDMVMDMQDFEALGLTDVDGDFTTEGIMIKARLKEFYEFLKK